MVSKEHMAFIMIAAVVTALIAGQLVMSCGQEHTQPKWNGFRQCYGDEDCKKLKDGSTSRVSIMNITGFVCTARGCLEHFNRHTNTSVMEFVAFLLCKLNQGLFSNC